MKQKILFLMALFSFLLMGGTKVWALDYPDTNKGWTKITSLPNSTYGYVYAIYHQSNDHVWSLAGEISTVSDAQNGMFVMMFKDGVDPMTNNVALWDIVKDGEKYNIVNANNSSFFFQTEGNNANYFWRCSDNGGGDLSWGKVDFSYDNGWKLRNNKYDSRNDSYLGPWHTNIVVNDPFAGNRTAQECPVFDIYQIERSKYMANRVGSNTANSSPANVTYAIANSHATVNADGWTMEYTDPRSNNYTFQRQTNNGLLGSSASNPFFEAWQQNGNLSNRKMYQTLAEVPNGKYVLKVKTDCESAGACLYLNDNKVELNTKQDNWVSCEAMVADNNIELGVELASYQSTWVKFDEFQLYYYGNGVEHYTSTDMPDGGSLSDVDTWYKVTIGTPGLYKVTSSAATGKYINGATENIDNAKAFAQGAQNLILEAGDYYFKAEGATTLTISTFQIATLDDLKLFSEKVNAGYTAMNAELTANIEDDGTFEPIGTDANRYHGTFDGKGYSVTLAINNNKKEQALFSVCSNATIQNVTVKGSVNSRSTDGCAAGIVAICNGTGTLTITNCHNEANITIAGKNAAGILGCNYNTGGMTVTITNCSNSGEISGDNECAAICGWTRNVDDNTITGCSNTGTITSGYTDGNYLWRGTVTYASNNTNTVVVEDLKVITNPGFETGNTNGWIKTTNVRYQTGTAYIDINGEQGLIEMGIWNKNTAQTFNDKISQTITNIPNGYYRVKAAINSANNVQMKLIANDNVGAYKSGSGWQWITVDTYVANGTLTIGATASATNAKEAWGNCDLFSLQYLGSTIEVGDDVTSYYISNPSFETKDLTGWTDQSASGMWTNMDRANATDPKVGNYWVEKYENAGKIDLSQTINNLPAGLYRVSVLALDQASKVALIAEGGSKKVETAIEGGTKATYTADVFIDENVPLKIGLYAGSHETKKWVGFDDFHLTYLGYPEVTAVEGKMNTTVAQAQTDALTAYNTAKTAANYYAALDAIDAARTSVEKYQAITDRYNTLDADGRAAYLQTTTGLAYNNNTYVDENTDADFATAARVQKSLFADYTLLITNPSFETGDLTGWTNQSADSMWTMMTRGNGDDPKVGTYWVEKYANAGKIDLSQTINNMPAGKYRVSVLALDDANKLTLKATSGETTAETTVNNGRTKGTYSVAISLEEGANLTIGLYSETHVADNWAGFDDFRITYLGNDIAYAEGEDKTSSVNNASCAEENNVYWSISNGGNTFHRNNWSGEGDSDKSGFTMSGMFIEDWRNANEAQGLNDATISHDAIAGLDEGFYVVSGQVRAYKEYNISKDDVLSGVSLFAGDNSVSAVNGSNCMYAGKVGVYGTYSVAVELKEGDNLNFGININGTNSNWMSFKNFTLTYYGRTMDEGNIVWKNAQSAANDAITAAARAYASYQSLDAYTALTNAMEAEATVDNLNTLMEATMTFTQAVRLARQADIEATFAEIANCNSNYTNVLQWTGGMGTGNGQHWSGSGSYYDNNGFATDKTETATITLPAGDYIYAAYGRGQAGSHTFLQYGETKFYFNNQGDAGFGVTTIGAPSVYAGDAYTNSNKGRGWDFGYIKFTLTESTEVTLSASYGSETSNTVWASLCTPMLYGNTELDYTELNSAVEATVVPTLGFAEGEYAPYNNVQSIVNVKNAQAMVQNHSASSQDEITALKNYIINIEWTVNAEEVNAFYPLSNYTSESAKDGSNRVYALGWNKHNKTDAENTRIMVAPQDANPGLTSNALFTKFNTKYGTEDGYTMPLAANTLYKLTFDYAGWGNMPTTNILIKDANGQAKTLSRASYTPVSTTGNTNKDDWRSFETYFVSGDAGNYTIELNKEQTNQQQTVLSNMVLMSCDGDVVRTTAVGKKGTICLPYNFEAEGAVIYTASVADEQPGVLVLEVVAEPQAGMPYIYTATKDAQSFEYAGGNVASTPNNDGILKGTYVLTRVPEGSYVMQTKSGKQAFYKVAPESVVNSGAYKCYLTIPELVSEGREVIYFGEEQTSVDVIDALLNDTAEIYDLSGRKLNGLQKGINIVNGKRVLVK